MAQRSNRIKNVASVNHSCSEEPVFESILRADGQQILFQQPQPNADLRKIWSMKFNDIAIWISDKEKYSAVF